MFLVCEGIHDRTNKESWSISSKVSNVISHQFNPQLATDDIALVKLEVEMRIF